MKSKKISLSEIRSVLNRDEMKKVIGGCGDPCAQAACLVGQINPCQAYGPSCQCISELGGESGQCQS